MRLLALCGFLALNLVAEQKTNVIFILADDLAVQMPKKASSLRAKLHTWRQSVEAQMMTPNPDYRPDTPMPTGVKRQQTPKAGLLTPRPRGIALRGP